MNEVMNRFGFIETTAHRRVPGPYVPLQDEPQDADDVRARSNTKTVRVPQVQSMKDYILKHHKRMIFQTLNREIESGRLQFPDVIHPEQIHLSISNCTFGEMNFWRYDTYTALVDVIVKATIPVGKVLVTAPLYVELWVNMKKGMDVFAGECGHLEDLPEQPFWRLSKYLIPILRKDEIETGAEELLLRFCPNALTDREEHDAYVLASKMGLNVEELPLYKKDRTLSMLFFCPGTVLVQNEQEHSEDGKAQPYEVTLPANTILINTNAVHKDCCQLEIYHECIHFDWHFMFYRLQDMHNNDINTLKAKRTVITDRSKNPNPLNWMEWQANRGSFGLMMPLSMMRPLVS